MHFFMYHWKKRCWVSIFRLFQATLRRNKKVFPSFLKMFLLLMLKIEISNCWWRTTWKFLCPIVNFLRALSSHRLQERGWLTLLLQTNMNLMWSIMAHPSYTNYARYCIHESYDLWSHLTYKNRKGREWEITILFYVLSKEVGIGSIEMNKSSPTPSPSPSTMTVERKRKQLKQHTGEYVVYFTVFSNRGV